MTEKNNVSMGFSFRDGELLSREVSNRNIRFRAYSYSYSTSIDIGKAFVGFRVYFINTKEH